MSIVVKDANGQNQTVGTLPPLGAANSANSLPVTVATDLVVKVDGSTVTQPVSGAVSVSNLPAKGAAASANALPVVIASDQIVNTQAFLPIPATAVALSVGSTATAAPVAMPAATGATVYRIRNSASSGSPVAWRLQTTTPGTAPVIPTAYSTAGTGGTAGDKQIDPGAVEVFALSAAQQAAAAAGTLYLSAITPSGGSATITVSLGTAGV